MKVRIVEGESVPDTLTSIRERLEFATSIKLNMERLLFTPRGQDSPANGKEIILYAVQRPMSIRICPRPGHPQDGPLRFFDIVPMILRILDKGKDLYLPLDYRFYIWTNIWGTSKLIKRLLEANPDLLSKAHALGVE